ncbi:replication initiation protein [Enterococcus sp. LJL90]
MNDLTVKYKNELNTIPLKKFNSVEMNLFFAICAKMKNQSQSKVRFSFDSLKELSEYKPTAIKRFVKDLENIYDKMLHLTYRETDNYGTIYKFVLFTGFQINPIHQFVEISINPELEYILNNLSNEFTQFELLEFTELNSSYSKSMYRLLKQFKTTGYYTVKISEFRELLDIPDSYKMSDIDKKVLRPIQKELSKYFEPFEITKIKAKKGNRIDRLEFRFREKLHDDVLPKVTLHNWLKE